MECRISSRTRFIEYQDLRPTPKKQPETASKMAAARVIQSALPSSADPRTSPDSMRFFATMNRPQSKANANRETVAAREANVVVRQVPEKPRIWAKRPSKAEIADNTAAARTTAISCQNLTVGLTLTDRVQDQNVSQPLDHSIRDTFSQVNSGETVKVEQPLQVCKSEGS